MKPTASTLSVIALLFAGASALPDPLLPTVFPSSPDAHDASEPQAALGGQYALFSWTRSLPRIPKESSDDFDWEHSIRELVSTLNTAWFGTFSSSLPDAVKVSKATDGIEDWLEVNWDGVPFPLDPSTSDSDDLDEEMVKEYQEQALDTAFDAAEEAEVEDCEGLEYWDVDAWAAEDTKNKGMFEAGREWDLWERVEEFEEMWEDAEEEDDMQLAPVFEYTKKEDVLDGNFDEEDFASYGHPDTGDHDDLKPIHKPKMPSKDPHGPHMNSTIYDLLQKSKHSKRFFEFIKEDKDLSAMLQDKNNNHTVFVPSNKAFDILDKYKKHHNVSKEMLHNVLLYHIAPGYHQGQDLRFHNTLLSALPAPDLGDDLHQRLRIGLNKKGPTVNFYSQFIMLDVRANNGVIHGLSSILLPPPPVKTILHCLPSEFSTTTSALKKTGLLSQIDSKDHPMTLFAPSNHVWKRLGHKITSFLFSSHGEKYLKAIMKYHIVPDHVLYSDAMAGSYRGGIPPGGAPGHGKPSRPGHGHDGDGEEPGMPGQPGHGRDGDDDGDDDGYEYPFGMAVVNKGVEIMNEMDDKEGLNHGYTHLDMPTLLKNKTLSVDITRMERFLSFRVNGLSEVVISDGITKSGVLHVLDHLLIPPHSLGDHRNPPSLITSDYGVDVDEEDLEQDLDIEVQQFLNIWTPIIRAEEEEEMRVVRGIFERMMQMQEEMQNEQMGGNVEEMPMFVEEVNKMDEDKGSEAFYSFEIGKDTDVEAVMEQVEQAWAKLGDEMRMMYKGEEEEEGMVEEEIISDLEL